MQSQSSPYVPLAAAGKTAREVAQIMRCDARTAARCLADARRILRERNEDIEAAASLLRHAGGDITSMPLDKRGKNISRRSWGNVALGLRKAA